MLIVLMSLLQLLAEDLACSDMGAVHLRFIITSDFIECVFRSFRI